MKVISPTPFTEDKLISSNATEAYANWVSTTTYSKDQIVDYGTHYYISLINSNLNNIPTSSPTAWLLYSSDNKHAMFDSSVDSQTTSTSPLTVVVNTGLITSLALLNLVGSTVNVKARNGNAGTIFYEKTINLDGTIIVDWFQYFFEPYDQLSDIVLTDIPPYGDCHIELTITGGSDVKIGQFLYGNIYEIGDTQYGASAGIRDYSVKETDEYGITTFVKRTFSKRMQTEVMLPNADVRKVFKVLQDLRATPCVWIGSDSADLEPLIVFGFYRDFNIVIPYPSYSMCSLEIEGLS